MQLTSKQREFILAHEREELSETALRFAGEDTPLLLAQIAGRKMAEKKIPSWYVQTDIFYPPHLSLEQASSELTARYKASLLSDLLANKGRFGDVDFTVAETNRLFVDKGNDRCVHFYDSKRVYHPPVLPKYSSFADLTGGMGVDFSFLSPYFEKSIYVDRNEDLCRMAEHNFWLLKLENTTVHCADAETFLKKTVPLDFVYLDPSRRNNAGQKVFRIEDCSPDLQEIKPLLFEKSGRVMVKYSPMLDISLAVKNLGSVDEVHVVSVDNECRELLFLLSKKDADETDKALVKEPQDEPLLVTVNLKRSGETEYFVFTSAQERDCRISYAEAPGRYLYEPNVSILKAGAFKSVAEVYHLQKLHNNSHLYTSDEFVPCFPGRVFEVETFFLPKKQPLKSFLRETKKANITVRNYPMTVAQIRRKTGLKEGGDIYLFATTFSDERKMWIVCKKYPIRVC